MANLESIVQQLRQERDRLDAAIRALTSLNGGTGKRSSGGGGRRRTLSAAARQRIAAAQRARWAKIKAKQR